MVSQRNYVIGSIIVIVILAAGGVGIYFAVSGGKSKSVDSKITSNDKLLIKSNDGTIKVYDRSVSNFIEVKAENQDFGITSFGEYLDQTIYYATTEPKSVIHSTNTTTYPDLPQFTANWIKTAIAVDYLTKKVYVADRIANKIQVVDRDFQYVLPLSLNEPKDVILAPEKGTMFILHQAASARAEIIMANMDGTNKMSILTHENIQALAVDSKNGFLYFAHQGGIESFDYEKEKKRLELNKEIKNVQSLAYTNMTLYFVNKKGKSSKNLGTSLDVCDLTNSKCMNKCCDVQSVLLNDQLDQVRIPKSEKPTTKNPCETKNGDCEQLCLLNTSADGRSCQCVDGWNLEPDKKTCKKATERV